MKKMVRLKDDTEVLIRDLRDDDVEQSLAFFQALPPADRIYLRNDVTRRDVIEERIRKMRIGKILRLVAINDDDQIVADGSLESEGYSWKDHVAELRLIVAAAFQRKSLGMLLARELYLQAVSMRVEELVAKVMLPQKAAMKVVERLGFKEQAVFPDYVKDIEGQKHDLIIMRCKLQHLLSELEDYFALSDWQRTR
jgi:L-amino acid N-acyltransferase YncA